MDRNEQLIAAAFRDIWKSIDDTARRVAASHLTGTVAAIDGNRVRLELLPSDPRTGKAFMSPWVQLQDAAGSTATHTPVALGDPMRLLSPHGEIGPASIAVRDSHVQAHPNPADDPNELVISHAGNELRMSADRMALKRGSTVIEFTDGKLSVNGTAIDLTGPTLTHNTVNVGATHTHPGVQRGGASTDTPQ